MCGILVSLGLDSDILLSDLITNRGPNYNDSVAITTKESVLRFSASVLHMRGDFCPQPLSNDEFIFAFNGEIYSNHTGYNYKVNNDTMFIFNSIASGFDLVELFKDLKGPYSFCLYNRKESRLIFGRDSIGRRSLLMSLESDHFILSSVALDYSKYIWNELEPGVIYCYSLDSKSLFEIYKLPSPLKCELIFIETASEYTIPKEIIDRSVMLLEIVVQKRIHFLRSADHPVNVLFSGGVDSLLLAILVHRVLGRDLEINLINVSFENPRVKSLCEESSDRKLGKEAFAFLSSTFKKRTWNFIAVNVSIKDYIEHAPRIYGLSYPQITMRDLSIASPLWFAARVIDPKQKVVLLGMGADEILGGYTRHRVAYNRGSWERLHEELMLDSLRIGTRNLGRDDRILSDHKIEPRFPFLDEDFANYCTSLPIQYKFNSSLPQGKGEKFLFRSILKFLNVPDNLCSSHKRAIQFGSKSAKIHNSRETGDDICSLEMFLNNINPAKWVKQPCLLHLQQSQLDGEKELEQQKRE